MRDESEETTAKLKSLVQSLEQDKSELQIKLEDEKRYVIMCYNVIKMQER